MANILEDTERRAVYLGRLASGLLKANIAPTLAEAYKAAKAILDEAGDNISITKRNQLTAAIRRAITEIDSEGWQDVTKELENIAIYDAGYYAGLVGSAVSVKLNTTADEKITSYINKAIMSLTDGNKVDAGTWAQFVKSKVLNDVDRIDSIIANGYGKGATTKEILRELKLLMDGQLTKQAEALVRTGVIHYSNQAREAMFIDNDVDEVVFVATLDNRTTLQCSSKDGNRYKIDDAAKPVPPLHFNCLSGDTLVSTCSDISNVYKRWYEGAMVNITTKSGRSIKITPNHPVLTSRGWIKAGLINLSDKVFTVKASSILLKENYKNSTESKFCDLFSALEVLVDSSLVSNRPAAAKDFHGDTTDSNVNVINTSGFRWSNVVESLTQKLKNKSLPMRPLVDSSFHSLSSEHLAFNASLTTSCGSMGSLCHSGNLLGSGVCHSSELLLTPVSWLDSERLEHILCSPNWAVEAEPFCKAIKPSSGVESVEYFELLRFSEIGFSSNTSGNKESMNYGAARSNSGSNLHHGHVSSEFEVDDVVDVRLTEYSGHVYNLENVDNWYLSNGIVTHNCRSAMIPAIAMQDVDTRAAVGGQKGAEAKDEFEQRQDKTDKKVKYRGRKDSDIFKAGQIKYTQYDEWLKSQPSWFVKSALGEKRAELFLSGKLSLAQFVDLAGRPLTLAELRALDGG